ncbi:MAG: 50S ribosomal protein L32 [Proteobacteria bacterium]|nr:50S ribosomal protein L32 [Pseudomonadota bacterium]
MAVPKKKTSKSRRGNRIGGNGAKRTILPQVLVDPTTGEDKLAHHISVDGYYNGKQVIEPKASSEEDKE